MLPARPRVPKQKSRLLDLPLTLCASPLPSRLPILAEPLRLASRRLRPRGRFPPVDLGAAGLAPASRRRTSGRPASGAAAGKGGGEAEAEAEAAAAGEVAGPLQLHSFGLGELRGVTHDFSASFLLGEGGFGAVYKGFVDAGMRPGLAAQPVAVKQLNAGGFQGHREWLAEVIFLGQFRHPHLVRLLGYCCEDEERLLVYEFMPRGSLENHLFRST